MTSVVGSSSAVRESSGRPSGRWLGRFPCLDDRATRSALCLKLILVLLHVIFGGALFILDTELRRRTREHPWYTAIYLVLYLATLVQYFFTSYSSPGYVIDVMMAGSGTHATFANLSSFDANYYKKQEPKSVHSNRFFSMVEASDGSLPSWIFQQDLDVQLLPHYSESQDLSASFCSHF